MNEAINSLRITLTFAPDRHDNKGMSTLMVTSPRDAEGKSTFAAHLAISMARTGVKVVLVEADTHRPTQCETFGVERVPGFSDVLQRRVSLSEVIRDTDYPSLFLLPAGSTGDDRTPTLLPDRIAEVFDELRAQFQTIIVDAPPVLPVYDSMVFGQEVDETVLLVRCDHSRFQTIDQARARLESVGIPVAGLVACGSKSANRYGYYYDTYATARGKASSSNGHAAANGHASSNGSAKPKKQTESPQES
jgi:capsular exopolysaccharide synthesis family protein